ncbi:MAG: 3-hydroxyacyl-ACP dehydratase FabZ [Elusimicrobia bacterium]|nr:3-hydroxyacyl-ACP dehydratase FabZ [Elusimicrobiota bacterium]
MDSNTVKDIEFDIEGIKKIIPHRYPFLMIDRAIVNYDTKTAKGYKCVSGNEEYFQGHFPGNPLMPGVLIIEAMAQTACVLLLSKPKKMGKFAYFMAINNVKFRKPVVPGDTLEFKIGVLREREKGGVARGEAFVNNELVTEAEFMFSIVEKEEKK